MALTSQDRCPPLPYSIAIAVITCLHFLSFVPCSKSSRMLRIYVSQLISCWRRLDCIFWASRRSCRRPCPAVWRPCDLEGEALPTEVGTTWTLLKYWLSALATRLGFGFCFGLCWDSFRTWTHERTYKSVFKCKHGQRAGLLDAILKWYWIQMWTLCGVLCYKMVLGFSLYIATVPGSDVQSRNTAV